MFESERAPPLADSDALPDEEIVPRLKAPAPATADTEPVPAATVIDPAEMVCADRVTLPPAVAIGLEVNVLSVRPAVSDTAPPVVVLMPAPICRSRPALAAIP